MAFCACNLRYIQNFLGGPFQMSEGDLLEVKDPETAPRYFVQVSGSKTVDTAIQEIETETRGGAEVSKRVSATYYALLIGDHWLLVKSESQMATTVKGSLETIPSDLHGKVFSTPEEIQLVPEFYPFYLDTTGFRYTGYWAIIVGIVYLLVLLYYVRRPLRWLQDPNTHPVLKRIQGWGEPMSVSADIERQLEFHRKFKHESFTFTDKYILEKRFFAFNVFRFEDLLWAYKQRTNRRVYFVIPAGTYYRAILVFYGGSARIPAHEKDVDATLLYAANKAPWAVTGYSDELSNLFNSQTAEFCAAIEARRQQVSK
jgi:hypothetical protein